MATDDEKVTADCTCCGQAEIRTARPASGSPVLVCPRCDVAAVRHTPEPG